MSDDDETGEDLGRIEAHHQTCETGGLSKQLRSGDAKARSDAGALLAKLKHSKLSPRTRRRQASNAVKVFWASLTPQQRRNEMRRRRKIGMQRKKKARGGRTDLT